MGFLEQIPIVFGTGYGEKEGAQARQNAVWLMSVEQTGAVLVAEECEA